MVQSPAPGIGPAAGGFFRRTARLSLDLCGTGGAWRLQLGRGTAGPAEKAASRVVAGSGRMLGSYLSLLAPAPFAATCSVAPSPALLRVPDRLAIYLHANAD
jgi:hypothetical protein